MPDYVIDANILVSILISGRASFQSIANFYHFSTPAFALVEIEKYQETIFQKSKLQPDELRRFAYMLFSKISIIPNFVLTQTCLEKKFT